MAAPLVAIEHQLDLDPSRSWTLPPSALIKDSISMSEKRIDGEVGRMKMAANVFLCLEFTP